MTSQSAAIARLMETRAREIDHIAYAVRSLEHAVSLFSGLLGFRVVERRTTEGSFSGMHSVVLSGGPVQFVLMEGTSPASQICRFIEAYGPGVQHVAIRVDDLSRLADTLREAGVEFATSIIGADGMRQIFTRRDVETGVMLEFIERSDREGFSDDSVTSLFEQLEAGGLF